jgi:hypothetical protein
MDSASDTLKVAPADKKTIILYVVLGISILGLLGVAAVVVYILLKPKTQQSQAPPTPQPPAQINVASVDPATGRYVLSPYQVESSCGVECTPQLQNHMCLNPSEKGMQSYFCVPDASNNFSWQTGPGASQQANSVFILGPGASTSDAIVSLSSAPRGTLLIGGPDTDMSTGAARNNENWTYWRGSDGLLY